MRKKMGLQGTVFRLLLVLSMLWSMAILISLYANTVNEHAEGDVQILDLPKRPLPVSQNISAHLAKRAEVYAKEDLELMKVLTASRPNSRAIRNRLLSLLNSSSQLDQLFSTNKDQQRGAGQNKIPLAHKWPPKAKPSDHGYNGQGVRIDPAMLNARERTFFDEGYQIYKVNQLASEMIPLRREIKLTMPECNHLYYNTTSLPKAGVVLIFHNEMWSALLRTVFSILDAGPYDLITEIILVDDASDKAFLGKPLEDYLSIFDGKVKLIRLPERKGLIEARLVGFEHVTGEVAIFLDAHCEVHKGWLEPLLQRIQEDDTVVAVPSTDRIDWDTFEYEFKRNEQQDRGGLDFDMNFNWIPAIPLDGVERKTLADPVKSATHLGCCFAVSKQNFERLGRYDPGLEIWGCENLELSFKAWMCGGRLEILPCSHVGHMYRPSFPYSWGGNSANTLIRNCLRVAEVWLDEYKVFYYERISNLQTRVDIGDISERKALRENLHCRSFDWYVKEIFTDLYIPTDTLASGRITNVAVSHLCVSRDAHWASLNQPPTATNCNVHDQRQHFLLTKEGQIRRDQGCLVYDWQSEMVVMKMCNMDNGKWLYTKDETIMSVEKEDCLVLLLDNTTVAMVRCNGSDPRQRWKWPRKSLSLKTQS